MSDEKVERIIVTVDDRYLSTIESVVTALESAGMTIELVLPISGIITGEVARSKLEGLKSVPGVFDVEIDLNMKAI
ncbi:MAG: hypothetical protein MUE44_36490 [Oscillatoriaceae cyanobacterium Prado104]|jgi:hypothetical protein|nr:hypothetical protein [Oscillatoriaceae cyanobacterium Prado104]